MSFKIGDAVTPVQSFPGTFTFEKVYTIVELTAGLTGHSEAKVMFPRLMSDSGSLHSIHPNNLILVKLPLPTEAGAEEYNEIMFAQEITNEL